jgi:cytochrome c
MAFLIPRFALPCAAAVLALSACGPPQPVDQRYTEVVKGDPEQGRALLAQYQCGSCHAIPDVPAAVGVTGPTLAAMGRRSYIAGEVPNNPQTLMHWIQSPRTLVPDTAMPDLGVTADDARHMAAYLMSLR